MRRRNLYVAILTLLLGFAGGFYFAVSGLLFSFEKPQTPNIQQPPVISIGETNIDNKIDIEKEADKEAEITDRYQEGYDDALKYAQKRISNKYWIHSPLTRINGTIQSIEGNDITVEYNASDMNVLEEGLATKIFTLSDNVAIEKHIPKTEEEIRAGPADSDLNDEGEVTFYNYKVEPLTSSSLNVGDLVELHTSNNIRTADPVEVFEIIVK